MNSTVKSPDLVTIEEAESETVPQPESQDQGKVEEAYLGGEYSSSTIKKIRANPDSIGKLFREGKYPYTDNIPRNKYEEEKKKLQIELLKVQNWVKMSGSTDRYK